MRDQSLYELLQVSENADQEIIQAAYRRLILRYHPDRSSEPNAGEMTQRLNLAYEILCDQTKRAQYDRELAADSSSRTAPPPPSPETSQPDPDPEPEPESEPKPTFVLVPRTFPRAMVVIFFITLLVLLLSRILST